MTLEEVNAEPGAGPRPEDHLEQALLALATARYDLRLFVSGASPLSARAVTNAREICEWHLPDRYVLTVIDARSEPAQLIVAGVLAVPALVRDRPLPRRVVVGDLSDVGRVLRALDIPTRPGPAA